MNFLILEPVLSLSGVERQSYVRSGTVQSRSRKQFRRLRTNCRLHHRGWKYSNQHNDGAIFRGSLDTDHLCRCSLGTKKKCISSTNRKNTDQINGHPVLYGEYCTISTVGSQGVTRYACELTVTRFRIWWYALR